MRVRQERHGYVRAFVGRKSEPVAHSLTLSPPLTPCSPCKTPNNSIPEFPPLTHPAKRVGAALQVWGWVQRVTRVGGGRAGVGVVEASSARLLCSLQLGKLESPWGNQPTLLHRSLRAQGLVHGLSTTWHSMMRYWTALYCTTPLHDATALSALYHITPCPAPCSALPHPALH